MVENLKIDLEEQLKKGMVEILSRKLEEKTLENDSELKLAKKSTGLMQEKMIIWKDKVGLILLTKKIVGNA